MLALLQTEWYKLRKTKIVPFILMGPLLIFAIAWGVNPEIEGIEHYQYIYTATIVNLAYALLFLPLMTGILAALICRYEHQAGGWKQLLALPTTRGKVFLSKYIILISITMFMQLLYLTILILVGVLKDYAEPFPLEFIIKSILGGWIATLPLIALQLALAIFFKSFAAPFAINIIFTMPSILVVNSEKYSKFYPWTQPFSMMYITGDTTDTFYVPWDQLLIVIGGGFVLFFALGYFYMQRKEV